MIVNYSYKLAQNDKIDILTLERSTFMTEIMKDAESFYAQGNNIGILLSHGFTGATFSMMPLAEAYKKVGYTVCLPRLAGHGTNLDDMAASTYEDWINSIEEGLAKLKETCDTIIMSGLSMGGTLTLYMAAKHPEIKAIIPINAAVVIPYMHEAAHVDNEIIPGSGSDIKKQGVPEIGYKDTPVKSILEIRKLMRIVEESLFQIKCPTLIFVSPEDHTVPAFNADLIYTSINSAQKSIIETPNSYHMATLDHDKEFIIEQSLSFVESIING